MLKVKWWQKLLARIPGVVLSSRATVSGFHSDSVFGVDTNQPGCELPVSCKVLDQHDCCHGSQSLYLFFLFVFFALWFMKLMHIH